MNKIQASMQIYLHDFLIQNPSVEWMSLNNEQSSSFVRELHNELTEQHPLYGLEAMALAKSEANDDVLFSMDDGKCSIVHLTYNKENSSEYPRFLSFKNINEALKYILNN